MRPETADWTTITTGTQAPDVAWEWDYVAETREDDVDPDYEQGHSDWVDEQQALYEAEWERCRECWDSMDMWAEAEGAA